MSIAIDNQAAITATTNHRGTPGQQLTNFFLNQMTEIAQQHQGVLIKLHWIPGHKGIPGNEEVDKLAKQAAMQHLTHHSNHLTTLPSAKQDSPQNQFLQAN